MATNPQFGLYEKLYFHEIDVREKLGARLQTPMAILLSLIGVLAFLLQNSERQQLTMAGIIFQVFIILSVCCLIAATTFFVRSWYNVKYCFLPSAIATENYRETLTMTYSSFPNGEELAEKYLNDYLCNYYIKASSNNTAANDQRSLFIHKMNGLLILATIGIVASFCFFYFGDLDKSKNAKPAEIRITSPIEIKGGSMTNKQESTSKSPAPSPLPPVPAPPPMREIREGVEVVKPKAGS